MSRVMLLAVSVSLFGGCMCSRTPSRVDVPDIDVDGSTAAVFELYDTDQDGTLSATEMESAGAIASAMPGIDTNSDGSVSKEEARAAINRLVSSGVGLMVYSCQVTLDGRALPDATLTFTPEPFMAAALKPASGVTDANGTGVVAISANDLPEGQKDLTGTIQPGMYRVAITHPTIKLPARYNTETTLGQLISPESSIEGIVVIPLKST